MSRRRDPSPRTLRKGHKGTAGERKCREATEGIGGHHTTDRRETDDRPLEDLLALLTNPSNGGDSPPHAKQPLERCEHLAAARHAQSLEFALLLAIVARDRLYESRGCASVRDYAEQHLHIRREQYYQFKTAAEVLRDLYNCRQFAIFPVNECQTRELSTYTAEERIAVWRRVLEVTAGGGITGKTVREQASAYLRERGLQTPDEPSVNDDARHDADHGGDGSEAGEADSAQQPAVLDDDASAADLDITERSAEERNPVALIFEVMRDGQPHPHPSHWHVDPERALDAYVFGTDSAVEQRKRRWEVSRANMREVCVARGMEAITRAFSTLRWTPLIARCRTQQGMYQISDMWLDSGGPNRGEE